MKKTVRIIGTRGVPAAHGGFETFAERVALYLTQKGWNVAVYCQEEGAGPLQEDEWNGIRRIRIPVTQTGAAGTVAFDWKSTIHAVKERGLVLTLGYNTAVFCAALRATGRTNVINMDGIEWKRQKWGPIARVWFYVNDWAGSWLGNHLIADHPQIKQHLSTRVRKEKITVIPYGADAILTGDPEIPMRHGLEAGRYLTVVARPEPENSILEIVSAFSCKRRGMTLAVLGNYDPAAKPYHRAVMNAASDEVRFIGAIYDAAQLGSLRFLSCLYVHGHQVGGTNPSLVEALGAGCPVLAHDNPFNRWVAGSQARYFANQAECALRFDELLAAPAVLDEMSQASRRRHSEAFTWNRILNEYEQLLAQWCLA